MQNPKPNLSHWATLPRLRFGADEYRLREGHVEFRRGGRRRWTELIFAEVQQHLLFNTIVGRWLAQLYSTAKLAKALAD